MVQLVPLLSKVQHLWLTLLVCLLLSPLLGGCVDYDLSVRFDSQTHGSLTQTLHLNDRFLALNEAGADRIFQQLTTRAKALSGKTHRLDKDMLQIVLPFHNGAQLVEQFNTFYGGNDEADGGGLSLPGAPSMSAHLALQQNNYIFVLRNRLTYDFQIQPVDQIVESPLSDLSWLNLDFHLTTPWGLIAASPPAEVAATDHTARWHLAANQPQHIEADFWVPSPIGIGAGAIALVCLLGYYIKYRGTAV
ncbi:MAG: DUF3153 domain-containing protein [Phormidesmis sp.]